MPVSVLRGRRRSAMLVGALMFTVAVAACESDDEASSSTDDSVATSAPAPSGDAPEADSAEWDAIVEAANEEGELVVYSSNIQSLGWLPEFEEAYPEISVAIERAPTSELLSRLDQELDVGAPGADVAFHAEPPWFTQMAEEGNLAAIQFQEVAEDWPAESMTEYYLDPLAAPYEMIWNTNLGEPIESAEDLLTAAEAGEIALPDPNASVGHLVQYDEWRSAFGMDFWSRLAELDPVFDASTATVVQSVAAGEFAYGMATVGNAAELKAEGAPIDSAVPSEGGVAGGYRTGILANAPHPNAAQVFIEWLMRPETLELIEAETPGAVVNPHAAGIEIIDLEEWPEDRVQATLAEFNEIFQN